MDPTSGETARIYQDLADTMADRRGAGIAAPQIGESARMFLIAAYAAGLDQDLPLVFINPEITWVSEDTEVAEEGCLSFPGVWLNVRRPKACKIKAWGLMNNEFVVEADGLYGRALQHEMDHLTGKLMMDLVPKFKQEALKKKFKRRKK